MVAVDLGNTMYLPTFVSQNQELPLKTLFRFKEFFVARLDSSPIWQNHINI